MAAYKPHQTFFVEQLKGNSAINFNTATLKVALFTATAAINVDTSTTYSTTNEVTGTGYVAGGATVTNSSVVYDSGENTFELRGDPVSWAMNAGGFTNARYAVLYSTSNNRIIASLDFGGSESNVSYTLGVIPNNNNEYVKITRPA